MKAIKQFWEESEAGWGSRPDGYSLHLTEKDRKAYIQKYWDSMPDKVPAEYSRPIQFVEIDIDEETEEKLKRSTNGLSYA